MISVRGDDGARAIGAIDDVGGRRRGASYGVFDNSPIETALTLGAFGGALLLDLLGPPQAVQRLLAARW